MSFKKFQNQVEKDPFVFLEGAREPRGGGCVFRGFYCYFVLLKRGDLDDFCIFQNIREGGISFKKRSGNEMSTGRNVHRTKCPATKCPRYEMSGDVVSKGRSVRHFKWLWYFWKN